MKARPILMSAPMVRSTLDGRKTQTRRTIKIDLSEKEHSPFIGADGVWRWMTGVVSYKGNETKCPYGQPGDVLWVRESMEADHDHTDHIVCGKYSADGSHVLYPGPSEDEHGEPDYGGSLAHWIYKRDSCPSIHMKRMFSRLTLEIVDVRVERLQDISKEDALAEGAYVGKASGRVADNYGTMALGVWFASPQGWYADLWQRLNGADSWSANPWVWVIEFKVHRQNVDDFLKARAA